MDALQKIRQSGFDIALVDGYIEISPSSKLTDTQRNYLKGHKPEIIAELKAEAGGDNAIHDIKPWQSAAILAWLAHIGERDPAIINEVLSKCAHDAEALAYFLGRAKELPRPKTGKPVKVMIAKTLSLSMLTAGDQALV